MAIVMNAKGTTSPYFKIGKQGTNIFQGSSDPSSSYTTAEGDLWIDTSNKIIKFRNSSNNGWTQGSLDITGNVTASGDLTINGSTTILDTVVQDVDQLVIGASNATYGARVNQASSGDILQLQDSGTTVVAVADGGNVGIGTDSPEALLNVVTGSAGTWTAPANFNDVVIESNTNAGLIVAVPDSDEGVIGISSPSNNGGVGYGMLYDYDAGIGRLFTSKVGASIRLDSDNQVTNLTLAGASGSESATFAGTIASSGAMTITTTDNNAQLTLVSTDADASGGPVLDLWRNSASPADSDFVGEIYFHGEDDAGNKQEYASIKARGVDVSSGSEDGRLEMYNSLGGNMKSVFLSNNIATPEIVINEDSEDINFRVESNGNANMLFVDGGADAVGIGTAAPAATLDVTGTDAIIIPSGTTAQRPGTPEAGMVRFNSTTSCFEGYNGSSWINLGAYN